MSTLRPTTEISTFPLTGHSLLELISTVTDANLALESLGMSQNMWDCLLVHHISRHLDKATREGWETSFGSLQDYPRLEKLETFLPTRVHALERIESLPTVTTTTTRPTHSKRSATAHQTSRKTTQDSRFHCDCCNSNHFIITCPQFRDLMVADRRKVAIDKRRCYNCLGRHNVRQCKSTQKCIVCSERHHTVFHGDTRSANQPTQAPALPAPSTSSTQ